MGVKHLEFDRGFADLVADSVKHTVRELFFVEEVVPLDYSIQKDPIFEFDISGIMVMAHENQEKEAFLIVSLTQETLFYFLEKFYNRKFDTIDASAKDGLRELTNIVHGTLKGKINQLGFDFGPDIPRTMEAAGYYLFKQELGESIIIPFRTPAGIFHVEVAAIS